MAYLDALRERYLEDIVESDVVKDKDTPALHYNSETQFNAITYRQLWDASTG